jgi:hypothetical protein
MVNGGLLQLVAVGKQDVFLTGNPQMTWFKAVYRRYTNFAIESQRMPFDNQADFGRRISCLIPRKGDLLGPLFLRIELPALTLADASGNAASYTNAIGHALIQEISVEIGEQEIDRHTGEWLEIWSNFTTPAEHKDALNNMIGKLDGYTEPTPELLGGPLTLYIPLRFWFCKNPGLYLPLLALQYHPVRINITLRPLQEVFYTPELKKCSNISVNPVNITKFEMWGDYIYLDTAERRKFVTTHHEYLIEQVQYTPTQAIQVADKLVKVEMEFNHPIRELFWFIQRDLSVSHNDWFNYSTLGIAEETGIRRDTIASAVLRLDGYDRFEERDALYFRFIQPYQRHTVVPFDRFIYNYSFALSPEDIQPSGSLNASRIDNMSLYVKMKEEACSDSASDASGNPLGKSHIRVYATNHNVLRIIDGFGGLLFRV